ncbi:UDP-N-acetylmuramate dehydrogenase [Raineya orbicola]|jgi:UDP-N-acetylmuramate dehydrogenase|uniref:UDP-N-acetylenolpyruvoylglucosamine reductase n=1 Tax=Raineya orbicola TaxID=2016530 RepID=A0A2N3II08_9BACT|nr:UDP-N-acetylmuramate dehydrogenase [Raineya orbicola]PKQ69934.1 murB: UDP-N-acetylenolpyruvoylglucosamine reductase [Raineya orbicola]
MNILENVSLKSYNTFAIDVKARYFVECWHIHEICDAVHWQKTNNLPLLILGGGSNVLFTQDFEGIVLKVSLLGKEIIREDSENVWLKVQAGENWNTLVEYCVANNWGGIENLTLIPGTVGAAPMQNIGAYGVELQDVFEYLEAFHLATGEVHRFDKKHCEFGYRESVFKNKFKNQYIILSVVLRLSKKHKLHFSYADVEKFLKEHRIEPSIKSISEAVRKIRTEKLPNPAEIGNAGSFFKNPYISKMHYEYLKRDYPNLPAYPLDENTYKVPAAWLIEQAGWKGYHEGNAGVHHRQALVLINKGNAQGKEIWELAQKIKKSIEDKFGIVLQTEVNIY